MIKFRQLAIVLSTVVFATFLSLQSAKAIPVTAATDPDLGGQIDLGFFAAGTYQITATGTISLLGPVGSGFDLDADGLPTSTVTAGLYTYFNPNGADNDLGVFGEAGAGTKLGALIGTFVAPSAPTGPSDWFLIGSGTIVNLAIGRNIYAAINDTFYGNNAGAFDVSVNQVSVVPIPAALPLMAGGLGLLGAFGWRRKRKSAVRIADRSAGLTG